MIFLIVGNASIPDKIKKTLEDTTRVFFDETNSLEQFTKESLRSMSLFDDVYTYNIQNVSNDDFINIFSKHKEEFLKTKNNFIFSIPSLTKKVEDACRGVDITFVKEETKKQISIPKVFALSDAYINHDKKRAYATFCEIINEGGTPEEILGTLIWQIKQVLNVYDIKNNKSSVDDFGMKPYTFSKTKSAIEKSPTKNTAEKILNDYKELVLLYHMGHNGIVSIKNALEKFILERV